MNNPKQIEYDSLPLVSVVMPTYNWEKYIERSLSSLLSQDYPNMNIVITDDCSQDNTIQLIKNIKQKIKSNIALIQNKTNKWIADNMNIGLHIADWKYIAILDQDDIRLDKSKISKQINFLEKNPDHWIVWTNVEVDQMTKKNNTTFPLTDKDIRNVILWICPFLHSSVVYNKALAIDIKWYSKKYKYAMDYKFFMDIMKQSKWANLEDVTTSYQMNWENISKQHKIKQLKEILNIAFINQYDFPNWKKSIIFETINLLFFILANNDFYDKSRPRLKQQYIKFASFKDK
jgi:glycosyltransferase involved in cell wall biosynthesis